MIQFDRVSFQYADQPLLLQDLNFSIHKGEYVSLIGGNGSGKSTIVQLMNGLLLPTSGSVTYDHYNTQHTADIHMIRQKMGMIFQNPEHQIVSQTVFEDVAFGLQNLGVPVETIHDRVASALKQVDMQDYQYGRTEQLSGGQLQKIAIAGVLVMDPEVIIFDESTSMLDPKSKNEVVNIIKHLHYEGMTVIHVTHDTDAVLESTRIIVLEQGAIVKDGQPLEVLVQIDWDTINVTPPYAIRMMQELRRLGLELPQEILTKEDMMEFIPWK